MLEPEGSAPSYPVPKTSAVLLLPPRLPPAPPATGEMPQWSAPEPSRARGFARELEAALADLQVALMVFETRETCGGWDELNPQASRELTVTLVNVRERLIRRMEDLRWRVLPGQMRFEGMDLGTFQRMMQRVIREGVANDLLDRLLAPAAGYAFPFQGSPGAGTRYRFEFVETLTAGLSEVYPWEFIDRLFEDLLAALQDEEHWKYAAVLDRKVYRKFLTVLYADRCATVRPGDPTPAQERAYPAPVPPPSPAASGSLIARLDPGLETLAADDAAFRTGAVPSSLGRTLMLITLRAVRESAILGRIDASEEVLAGFKSRMLRLFGNGTKRGDLYQALGSRVFGALGAAAPHERYRYQLRSPAPLALLEREHPRMLLVRLLKDLQDALEDDATYAGLATFRQAVYEKYAAVVWALRQAEPGP